MNLVFFIMKSSAIP